MFTFDSGVLVPVMIFLIPIVAIAGGITAGIVKMLGEMRMLELARRERIAAIERGVNPEKLPPVPTGQFDNYGSYVPHEQVTARRAQGLLIGGLVTLAVGVGLMFMMRLLPDEDAHRSWAVGMIPAFVGVALLLSSLIVRRSEPRSDQAARPPLA